ncbi:MAG: geranylgeranylglycerol-phosphate geranylgeranyltransferase [Crocinitomicaceae bacterium]|nr:geranylgeranylglycerol-phosphate geranylgeranyltransferase [Crocinitomicaceae bacterium]MBP6033371.1 geranylgeranylglycerol-phosphate geranylgeranyltransferase [Crocinitomicaceae bacterium]
MKYFLKLIRAKNLLIIVMTMIGVAFYLMKSNSYQKVDFHYADYFLLIFSTMIIAAAGNVINDYFDVKADRINKPEKVIISKFMKSRWAILWHWSFNLIAFLIAVYLSVKYATLIFVFVHLLSINLLWFYSVQLKRKLIISNLIIAFLTALVPLLSVWFFKVLNESSIPFSPYREESWSTYLDYSFIYFLAICAFIQNFAREINKDIHDIQGDLVARVESLPMKIGKEKAAYLTIILIQIPLILFIFGYYFFDWFQVNKVTMILLLLSGAVNFTSALLYIIKKESTLTWINHLMKWSMFFGLICLFSNSL